MLIGYLNLTADQLATGLTEPHNALISAGIDRLYIDVSPSSQGVADPAPRPLPQLDTALGSLAAGDTLVSPTVTTLARSVQALLDLHARLEPRGIWLRVLSLAGGLPLDTATVEGRAILGALAVMNSLPPAAQPLRPSLALVGSSFPPMRPRGRPPTAGSQADEVVRLRSEGLRAVEIAACLGIGRASVYRILSQGQSAGAVQSPPSPATA